MFTKFKVFDTQYHRNGVSGVGFYAIHFSYVEDSVTRNAIATVSSNDFDKYLNKEPYDPETRVLMFGPLGGIDISETMRGDYFNDQLMDHIKKHTKH